MFKHFSWKWFFVIAISIVVILVSLPTLWLVNVKFKDEARADRVRKALKNISGVEIIKFEPYQDVTMESIYVEVSVDQKMKLAFSVWDSNEFNNLQNLHLLSIGNYGLTSRVFWPDATGKYDEKDALNRGLNIGPAGTAHSLMPVKINGIDDVINNYDKIYKVVSSWPQYPDGVLPIEKMNSKFKIDTKSAYTNDNKKQETTISTYYSTFKL